MVDWSVPISLVDVDCGSSHRPVCCGKGNLWCPRSPGSPNYLSWVGRFFGFLHGVQEWERILLWKSKTGLGWWCLGFGGWHRVPGVKSCLSSRLDLVLFFFFFYNHVWYQQNQAKIYPRSGESPKVFAESGVPALASKSKLALPHSVWMPIRPLWCHLFEFGVMCCMHVEHISCVITNCGQHQLAVLQLTKNPGSPSGPPSWYVGWSTQILGGPT